METAQTTIHFSPMESLAARANIGKPSARSGATVVQRGDDYIYFGGLGFAFPGAIRDELFNDVHTFNTKTHEWRAIDTKTSGDETADPFARPTGSFGASALMLPDGDMVLFGGMDFDVAALDSFHHLCTKTWTWTKASIMEHGQEDERSRFDLYRWGSTLIHLPRRFWPRALGSIAKQVSDAFLIVLGDGMASCNDLILVYRLQGREAKYKWHAKKYFLPHHGPPGRRRHFAGLYRDEFIVVFGGRSDLRFLNDLWVFSLHANAWAQITPSSSPQLLTLLFNSHTLHTPSSAGASESARRVQRTAINSLQGLAKQKQSPVVAWPEPRTGVVGFFIGRRLYISTGFQQDFQSDVSSTYNDIWEFDLDRGTWSNVLPSRNFEPWQRNRIEAEFNVCLGPVPNSMSTVMKLKPTTLFFLGGRQYDVPLAEGFVCHMSVNPPRLVTWAYQTLLRMEVARRVAQVEEGRSQRHSQFSAMNHKEFMAAVEESKLEVHRLLPRACGERIVLDGSTLLH